MQKLFGALVSVGRLYPLVAVVEFLDRLNDTLLFWLLIVVDYYKWIIGFYVEAVREHGWSLAYPVWQDKYDWWLEDNFDAFYLMLRRRALRKVRGLTGRKTSLLFG